MLVYRDRLKIERVSIIIDYMAQKMEKAILHDREYDFISIIWEVEPIASGELTKICEKRLGWKRTTTYTVLKKLCDKGILQNQNTIVTSCLKKQQVQRYESKRLIERMFDNSLPAFIASFMDHRKLTKEEAEQLKEMIAAYEDGDDHD